MPQHEFTKEKPDLTHLYVFGYIAYIHNKHAKKKGQIAPKAEKIIFLGYTKI